LAGGVAGPVGGYVRPVPKVLITGASSGIGLAAAEAVARRGADVVATVRRSDDADTLAARFDVLGLRVEPVLLELTDADQARAVIDRHRPDVLVNNAGTAAFQPLMDTTDEHAVKLLDLLVVAPARLARLTAEHLRRDGRPGRIVDVSSALGTLPLPLTGWYSAGKAALSSLSDSLRTELAPDGIVVVRVELGAIDTGIWADAVRSLDETDSGQRRFASRTTAARPLFGDVTTAARAIAQAACARHPRSLYRAGFGAQLVSLAAHAPTTVRDPLVRLVLG
jgi:NAD(P)-dependent dehydrogenase (short-subunit alcohol dehydrogenase family)